MTFKKKSDRSLQIFFVGVYFGHSSLIQHVFRIQLKRFLTLNKILNLLI